MKKKIEKNSKIPKLICNHQIHFQLKVSHREKKQKDRLEKSKKKKQKNQNKKPKEKKKNKMLTLASFKIAFLNNQFNPMECNFNGTKNKKNKAQKNRNQISQFSFFFQKMNLPINK